MPILIANVSNNQQIATPEITPTIKRLTGIHSKETIIEFEDISKNRRNHLIKWHKNFCESNYLLDQCPLAIEIRAAEIGLIDYWLLNSSIKERI